MISATFSYEKKHREVLGRSMAYVDEGQGDPIVFLHGNPTSSYVWRNILPYVQRFGRILAPDLIGMGDSQKLPESGPCSYTFVEHRRYLDALLEALLVNEQVTFVLHDWGRRHPDAVKGLAYSEANVRPFTWEDFPELTRQGLQMLRGEAGEQMIL